MARTWEPVAQKPLRRLASVDNFRDVAGPAGGYEIAGGRMRRGIFYRANRIEASEADARFLATLGLTAIHDLREPVEVDGHPDVPIEGADWLHHPVYGIPDEDIQSIRTADQTYEAMLENYRTFVSNAECRAGFTSLFGELIARPGSQLFHCAAGKDRTGWAAALLQHIAGADHATIVADYLLTDEYAVESRKASLDAVLEHLGEPLVPAFEPAFRCETAYLEASLREADVLFGGVDGYLRDGLHIGDEARDQLRERLTIPDPGHAVR